MTEDVVTVDVQSAFELLAEAMELADVTLMQRLLTDEFVLTHITGQEQSKTDWLAEIDAGTMQYHSVDIVEMAVGFRGSVTRPVLTAQCLVEATIWGLEATWHLQFTINYFDRDGEWAAGSAVTSSW